MKNNIYTVRGITGNIPVLCKYFGKSQSTVRNRLLRGMNIEEALFTESKNSKDTKIYTIDGVSGDISYLCEYFGKTKSMVKSRLSKGMSIEEALLFM